MRIETIKHAKSIDELIDKLDAVIKEVCAELETLRKKIKALENAADFAESEEENE